MPSDEATDENRMRNGYSLDGRFTQTPASKEIPRRTAAAADRLKKDKARQQFKTLCECENLLLARTLRFGFWRPFKPASTARRGLEGAQNKIFASTICGYKFACRLRLDKLDTEIADEPTASLEKGRDW
jgi:hypothetical protein